MANYAFDIKSRVNAGTPLKTTSLYSPIARSALRSPNKFHASQTSLSLRTIVGTTSTSSSGLSCDYGSNTFAYCAGSAAVLAKVGADGDISYKYFRAHPTSEAIHPYTSFYSSSTPTGTPGGRRRMIVPLRNRDDRSAASSPRRNWAEDGSAKTWSARERVKAVSCVHLSPNGRFLAVGETGYNPRVNIFSVMEGLPGHVPLSILTEHSFGVRNLAFSPDSRWLATLGDVNDGFLFIWSVSPKTGAAKLHQTNKCTAMVLDMAWCGSSLVTVGTRHVKLWRIEKPQSSIRSRQGTPFLEREATASPAPKTLPGRNCRLGALVDATFTCVAPLSEKEALICTRSGVVCVLDDRDGNQNLRHVLQLDFSVSSAAIDIPGQKIWFSNPDGDFQSESFQRLSLSTARPPPRRSSSHQLSSSPSTPKRLDVILTPPSSADRRRRRSDGILASKCLPGRIVTIDQDRKIRLTSIEDVGESSSSPEVTLPAHDEAVQGVIVVPDGGPGDYMTWSLGGTIKFWCLGGSVKRVEKVELEQPERTLLEPDEYVNELKTLRIAPDTKVIVAGDRHGVLQIITVDSWTATQARAHSAEITDIALLAEQDSLLVATAGRDRTVQLLRVQDGTNLVQTLDDHVGAVNSVAFVEDLLISASADRTVIIRQKIARAASSDSSIAYVSSRVITLKASPTSMTFPEPEVLVVATMDRQVLTFNSQTGALVDGFKALDAEGEDAVVLNALTITSIKDGPGCRRILTGYSSTDKSIRAYDYDNGLLLARELGHTDGVSGMAILSQGVEQADRKILVSTGMDGLIMTWNVASTAQAPSTPLQEIGQGQAMNGADAETPTKESVLKRPPLRKVLSKMDLMDAFSPKTPNSASRDPSPSRMKRRPSRYTLVSKNGATSTATPLKVSTGDAIRLTPSTETDDIASPSPVQILSPDILDSPCPAVTVEKPTAKDTKTDEAKQDGSLRSPSAVPVSLPSTPKNPNRSGKFRLRRPPSIPADLHMHSQALARRKSMGNVHEFGSLGMATEQMCRTLQAYRKKIKTASKTERLQLDEVEMELSATLRAVQERRDVKSNRRNQAATENELDR